MLIPSVAKGLRDEVATMLGQLAQNGPDHCKFKEAVRSVAASATMLKELVDNAGSGGKTMNLKAAGKTYGVPVSTLRVWCDRGILPARKVGKLWYVEPAAMDNLFKNRNAGR